MSVTTGIEYLSKTRSTYEDELSFANMGLTLNTAEDGLLNMRIIIINYLNSTK